MLAQAAAPLVEGLQRCSGRRHAAFYTPGHKRGQGISALHRSVFGGAVFRVDLPELPELDDLFAPESVILEAQILAAEAFGAQQSWFLVNGSTCGIEAALLATCGPGDRVLVPRNAHQSVLSGLIVSGAMPVWLTPMFDADWQLSLGISIDDIAAALVRHPDARAVVIVSPTYEGVCSDVAAIAALVHGYGIPLIVDAAHGPHFAFHPELPVSALDSGADIVVHSTHKVLSALTQAAMVHVQGERCDRNRLNQALRMTQSSSPSYLLLASLDAARHQMANQGHALMDRTLGLARLARQQLQAQGLPVLNAADLCGQRLQQDVTRLTVDISVKGLTGFAADEWLHGQGVTAELPSLRHLTFIVSLGNCEQDMRSLVQGLCRLPPQGDGGCGDIPGQLFSRGSPSVSGLSPRDAFFAETRMCSIEQARGRLSADTVCVYPPGIPCLMPGEMITVEAIEMLQLARRSGAHVSGLADATFQTLRVVQGCR